MLVTFMSPEFSRVLVQSLGLANASRPCVALGSTLGPAVTTRFGAALAGALGLAEASRPGVALASSSEDLDGCSFFALGVLRRNW
jgi:hypothetical protein